MSDTPTYCLGRNTIERVANESQLITDKVCFIAASDLYQQNPYDKIKELETELEAIKNKTKKYGKYMHYMLAILMTMFVLMALAFLMSITVYIIRNTFN